MANKKIKATLLGLPFFVITSKRVLISSWVILRSRGFASVLVLNDFDLRVPLRAIYACHLPEFLSFKIATN